VYVSCNVYDVTSVVQLKCLQIILFMFAMMIFHLLFLISQYIAFIQCLLSIFCFHMIVQYVTIILIGPMYHFWICGIPLCSMCNCMALSQFVWIHVVFGFWYMPLLCNCNVLVAALLSASLPPLKLISFVNGHELKSIVQTHSFCKLQVSKNS